MGWQTVQESSSNEWTWKPAFKKLDHREGITEGKLSAGPIPAASLGLWWPRGGWRGGLQVAYGTTPWGVSCGVAPEYEDHSCHAVAGSINLVIEKNDLWRGLVLQGGVGPNLVGSGGAGFGFLGTLGLGWRW